MTRLAWYLFSGFLCLGGHLVAFADEAALEPGDQFFLRQASKGGLLEVRLAELAAERVVTPAIQDVAAKLLEDHRRANERLKAFADRQRLALPTELGKHQLDVDRLAQLSGPDFGKAYLKEMIEHHEQAVATFQRQAEEGADPHIRAWAMELVTTLRDHLRMAQGIAEKLSVDTEDLSLRPQQVGPVRPVPR
jgi:putative membrane protein